MANIVSNLTSGELALSDSWSISATGSSGPPQFSNVGDEFIFSYINLENVETLKNFSFDYTGQTELRYLEVYYRLSRDQTNYTEWLPITENKLSLRNDSISFYNNEARITNFPPFSSRDTMFLDLKFVREGTSTVGTIKLLEYELTGSLERNISDGLNQVTVTPSSDPLIIKPPFIYKVFSIEDVEIISNSTLDEDFTVKYRFSQDYGRTVTEWEFLTKENIKSVRITPIRFFQIEYLIEVTSPSVTIYDINLIGDFQNVSLDYFKTNLYGSREDCNCLKLGIVNDPSTFPAMYPGVEIKTLPVNVQAASPLPQLTTEQEANLFKPYQLQQATDLLNKLSNDANSIFGHEVVYFLTDPDKRGIDYTFHEYQLYNFVSECLIKVSVENNQFPENTGAITQFDLSLFDSFEIHRPKKNFKEAFGADKRPSKEDFLWFCEINKMFLVEHSQAFRSFNNNAIYYKLMLKKYSQKASVIGANKTISDKLSALTRNSTIDELFGLENQQDKAAVANKDQFRPLTQDPIRSIISAQIIREFVYNSENVISTYHYDLSTVTFSATQSFPAVTYQNFKRYFDKGSNLSFICWFNIFNLTTNDNYHLFNYYDNSINSGLDINIQNDIVSVKWNNDTYSMILNDSLEEDTWYGYLVNINQRQRKITQYIYKRDVDDEEDAEQLNTTILRRVYKYEQDLTPVTFTLDGINAQLLSGDMKLTNIRLFTEVIPESEINKILNQNIIRDDSKFLLLADNANKKLVLPNYGIGQIGDSEV
jgi:hypothetical protein